MEAIIVGGVFCAFVLGIFIFAHTKKRKRIFGRLNL
jgi:Na+/H+-dicarboxylate symporter